MLVGLVYAKAHVVGPLAGACTRRARVVRRSLIPRSMPCYGANAMTRGMADLTRHGQPRGMWILGGCSCLAIGFPVLLRPGITAYTAGHYGGSHAAQESPDQHSGGQQRAGLTREAPAETLPRHTHADWHIGACQTPSHVGDTLKANYAFSRSNSTSRFS